MGTTLFSCGCYVSTSMYGEHEVVAVGHCWQHQHLYSQDKTPRQMAEEIRGQDHEWRERPDPESLGDGARA